jgi:mRNA deadenylase 3'-5' endonuclease subunit Ccr4
MSHTKVEVVQYNILSDALCTPDMYIESDPDILTERYRFDKLTEKLRNQIVRHAIICLQEISQNWIGKLHVFFKQFAYTFICTTYGHEKNGYMGVGIAYPPKYGLDECKIVRIGDTMPKPQIDKSIYTRIMNTVWPWIPFVAKIEQDPLVAAKSKWNQAIMLRLLDVDKPFIVSTYHMPCDFERPAVMSYHVQYLIHAIKKFGGESKIILCADMNIRPETPLYVTMFGPVPMRSAYLEFNGKEPKYTNCTKNKFNESGFIDTLDYILISPDITVSHVMACPESFDICPNEREPSDHIMIGAQLSIPV